MYERILVPYDGSPTSDEALAEAVRLAKLCSSRLRLIHVVDPLLYITGFEVGAVYANEILPGLLAAGETLLRQARDPIEAQGLVVESEVIQSSGERVARIVVEQAALWKADLIVLGTHGRRGVDRVLMGSDAELVARTSPVPVLLVRAKA
ncbi:MAG: universal stress protein [Burkholderiales bacterium]|nr:MAG: universal stress protein [Burkholderiales bacterium]